MMMDTNNNSTNSNEQSATLVDTTGIADDLNLSPFSLDSADFFDVRTCPTPDVSKLNDFLLDENNYNPFSDKDNDEIMALLQESAQPNNVNISSVTFNNVDNGVNTAAAAPLAFNDGLLNLGGMSPSTFFNTLGDGNHAIANPLLHQTSSTTLLSSVASPYNNNNLHNNNSSFINQNNSFVPIDVAKIKREEDNQTPQIFPTTSTMQLIDSASNSKNSKNKGGGRMKEKCMSRNAILARQNREKKKSEQKSMAEKMENLEGENASLKKECQEYKTGMEKAQTRVKYLEAVIQNIPQILDVIEHVSNIKSIPSPSSNSNQT